MPAEVAAMVSLSFVTQDISLLSSVAVIVGVIFVVIQLRQNNRIIKAAADQAEVATIQTRLTTEQIKQNNTIADMDIVMRLYEFANSAEVQTSWLAVLHSDVSTAEDLEKLPLVDQVHFYQIAALFESLGVLRKKGMVDMDTIEDMFMVSLAWEKLQRFIEMNDKALGVGQGEGYVHFAAMAGEMAGRANN